jgi:hypothetical protein
VEEDDLGGEADAELRLNPDALRRFNCACSSRPNGSPLNTRNPATTRQAGPGSRTIESGAAAGY